MGIDLYYTDNSLKECSYALCNTQAWKECSNSKDPWEAENNICKKCPIRPVVGWNDVYRYGCSLRFSNYPSMGSFRWGFNFVVASVLQYTEEKLQGIEWAFTFPMLHVKGGENKTPKQMIDELWKMTKCKEYRNGCEFWFPELENMLKTFIEKSGDSGDKIVSFGTKQVECEFEFADRFLTKLVYRNTPINPKQSSKFLPYIELLLELSEYIIESKADIEIRSCVSTFYSILTRYYIMLKNAVKYNLMVEVSH